MDRYVIIDHEDRIVNSEHVLSGQGPTRLSKEDVPAGGAFLRMTETHEDFRVPVGETVIP